MALRERLPTLRHCELVRRVCCRSRTAKTLTPTQHAQSGVSAGALTATLAACDVDLAASVDLAYALTLENGIYDRKGGLAGVWGPLIRRWLLELLPADAAAVCSGRVALFSLAVWPLPPRRLVVSEFSSKEHLVDTAMVRARVPAAAPRLAYAYACVVLCAAHRRASTSLTS